MATQTVTGAVARREAGPVTVMWGRRAHFKAVLPASVDVEAFLGTAAGALYASADLMEAATRSPDSLIVAMMRCAALGHMPGTDEFYLTPRKKKGVPQVLGIEGYRGVIERMYRSGAVAKVVVREVCAKDQFSYTEGADDKPVHSFGGEGSTGADFFGATGFRDRGPMVGVYAYAQLTTGAYSRPAILNRADVEAARDAGGWKPDDLFSPWNRMDAGKDHPEFQGRSMWWKTAAKRLEPWVPTSAEYRREQLRASASAAAAAAAGPAGSPASGAASYRPREDEAADIHDADVVEDQAAGQPLLAGDPS
jgi:recombination protein RecT